MDGSNLEFKRSSWLQHLGSLGIVLLSTSIHIQDVLYTISRHKSMLFHFEFPNL